MKRTQKNTKLLENIVEISHMLLSDNNFCQSFMNGDETNSVEQRHEAIDAALIFDEVEEALLERADESDWNYEWMDATEQYVNAVIAGETNLRQKAREAILSSGLQLAR